MIANWNTQLAAYHRAPDQKSGPILEAVVRVREAIKRTKADWTAGTITGLTATDDGRLRLTPSGGVLIDHTDASPDYDNWQDLSRSTPYLAFDIDWGALPRDAEIVTVKVHVHPRRDGGAPRTAQRLKLELYEVVKYANFPSFNAPISNATIWRILPLIDAQEVAVTGDAPGLFTFTFIDTRRPRGWFNGGAGIPPRMLVRIVALTATGAPADNVAIGYDSSIQTLTENGHTARPVQVIPYSQGDNDPNLFNLLAPDPANGVPVFEISAASFAQATATYSGANAFDLGAAPSASNGITFVKRAEIPGGCAIVTEVRNDADTDWVPFDDGDVPEDNPFDPAPGASRLAGVTIAQLITDAGVRAFRATLTPDGVTGLATPALRAMGMEESRSVWWHKEEFTIDGLEYSVDPFFLKPAIPAPRVRILRDLDPGRRDRITRLLSEHDYAALSFRLWIGHRRLPRRFWVLKDEFLPRDHDPADAYIDLHLLGVSAQLKQALPKATTVTTSGVDLTFDAIDTNIALGVGFVGRSTIERDSGSFITDGWKGGYPVIVVGSDDNDATFRVAKVTASKLILDRTGVLVNEGPVGGVTLTANLREAYAQTNVSLKDLSNDLLDNQLAIPGRYRGQGIEDDTTLVSATVDDGEAKALLDRVAYIARGCFICSQGQITFRDFWGEQTIKKIFRRNEITVLSATPGLRLRAPEAFLRYNHDPSRNEFQSEARGSNQAALAAFGRAYVGEPSFIDEEIGRLIYDDTLATNMVDTHVRFFGPGLIQFEFQSIYDYPELELGDCVAIETHDFVAKDPHTARALRGRQFVIARLVYTAGTGGTMLGNHFKACPRSYADIIPSFEKFDRNPRAEPRVAITIDPIPGNPGQRRVTLRAYPIGATAEYLVQAAGAQVPLPGDDFTAYTQPFTISVLNGDQQVSAYATLNGRIGPLEGPIQADEDDVPEATVTVSESPAGTARVSWSVDDDVKYVHLYRRKHATNWPTLDGTLTGVLDEAQLIGTIHVAADGGARDRTGPPLTGMSGGTGIGGTIWVDSLAYALNEWCRVIVVPIDRNGNAGARASAAKQFTNSSVSPALDSFTATKTDSGSSCSDKAQNTISWSPNGGVVGATHDLRIFRSKNSEPRELLTTIADPSSTGTTSYVDTLDLWEEAGAPPITFVYSYELIVTAGPTVIDTGQASPTISIAAVECPA